MQLPAAAAEALPGSHGSGAVAPTEHALPASHSKQSASEVLSDIALCVPSGHDAGSGLPPWQYAPAGQAIGSEVAPEHEKPAGQSPEHCGPDCVDSWRS